MKVKELREKSREELENLLQEKQADLVQAKVDKQRNQLRNTCAVKDLRKDIARILTLLGEMEKNPS